MEHHSLTSLPNSPVDQTLHEPQDALFAKGDRQELTMPAMSSSPSPNSSSPTPLRLAVLGAQAQHSDFLSFLEQLPGVEIIRKMPADLPQTHQPPRRNQFASPTESREHSPHILLDLQDYPKPDSEIDQPSFSDIDVIKRHAVDLLEKVQQHQRGTQQHMTQIEKLANIGTLASGILHDINNPLYVILGFSELLLDETLPPEMKEPLTEMVQATRRIMRMCQDLNLYSRDRPPHDCAPTNVVQQLEEALKVAKFASGLENIHIVRSFESEPLILAKQEEIIQIFVNLIVNALQAMNGQGTLSLSAHHSSHQAHLSIGDTGPGIPPEIMDTIFNPFFTTKPPGKGTGLGLHSVRLLVKNYGGQINLESTVGKGTTFHLTFPLYGLAPVPHTAHPSPSR